MGWPQLKTIPDVAATEEDRGAADSQILAMRRVLVSLLPPTFRCSSDLLLVSAQGGYVSTGFCSNGVCAANSVCWQGRVCCALASSPGTIPQSKKAKLTVLTFLLPCTCCSLPSWTGVWRMRRGPLRRVWWNTVAMYWRLLLLSQWEVTTCERSLISQYLE